MINSQELWLRETVHSMHVSSFIPSLSSLMLPTIHWGPKGQILIFLFSLVGGPSLSPTPPPTHVITSSCLKWHSFSLLPLWSRYRVGATKHSLEEEVKSIQRINILKIVSSWHRSLYIISSPLGSVGMNLTVFQVRKLFKPSFTLIFSCVFPYLKLLLAWGRPSKLGGHPLI